MREVPAVAAGIGVVATVIPCSAAISAYVESQRWQQVLHVFRSLQLRSLEAAVTAYTAAINACKNGRWQQALHLLGDVQQSSLEVDVITYNAAISACGESQPWQQALHCSGTYSGAASRLL